MGALRTLVEDLVTSKRGNGDLEYDMECVVLHFSCQHCGYTLGQGEFSSDNPEVVTTSFRVIRDDEARGYLCDVTAKRRMALTSYVEFEDGLKLADAQYDWETDHEISEELDTSCSYFDDEGGSEWTSGPMCLECKTEDPLLRVKVYLAGDELGSIVQTSSGNLMIEGQVAVDPRPTKIEPITVALPTSDGLDELRRRIAEAKA